MSKIQVDKDTNIFGALKLIEQLYLDEKIPKYIYRNILKEYADDVDTTAFVYDKNNRDREAD